MSAPRGLILLARGNRILEETIRDQVCLEDPKNRPQALDVKLCDFDEVSYNITYKNEKDANNPLLVSIHTPCYEEIRNCGTDDEIKKMYGDMVSDKPEANQSVTLKVDLENLPTDEKEKEALVLKLSIFKFTLLSGPFRTYFKDLAEGKNSGNNFKFNMRSDTTVYLAPKDDKVTVIYGVDYQDKVDKCLVAVFMQELADARKRIRSAPPFLWAVSPPKELSSFGVNENPGILGYASIAVMKNHVTKGQDDVVGALINFRSFLQYHIKCAKSYFHSRMRARCSDLLKILNRAKVRFGEAVKRTKSGKTFTRN